MNLSFEFCMCQGPMFERSWGTVDKNGGIHGLGSESWARHGHGPGRNVCICGRGSSNLVVSTGKADVDSENRASLRLWALRRTWEQISKINCLEGCRWVEEFRGTGSVPTVHGARVIFFWRQREVWLIETILDSEPECDSGSSIDFLDGRDEPVPRA